MCVMRWLIVSATLPANKSPPTAITMPIKANDIRSSIRRLAMSKAASFGVSFTPRAKQIDIADNTCK